MKYVRIFLVLLAVTTAKAGDLDGIAVVVNNSVITVLQVQDGIADALRMLRSRNLSDPTNFMAQAREVQRDELEMLIENKLILAEFERGEYTTNWLDDAVKKTIDDDIKTHYSGSRTKMIQMLHLAGLTFEDYKKQQRENVIVMALSQLHADPGKVVISPTAIGKYYDEHMNDFKVEDQVKLRTIRVSAPPDAPSLDARQLAGEILQRIESGVPFAEMAKVNSTDEYRASGGDRGWVDHKTYVGVVGDAAFALKPGEHSKVLELPDDEHKTVTCYILMVDDVRPAHVRPLSEVQGEIEQTLKFKRGKELRDKWIERLKAKSQIQTFAQ